MIGLEASTFFSTAVSLTDPPTFAKYRIANLALTVLPAPDSPETIIDWFSSCLKNKNYVSEAYEARIHKMVKHTLIEEYA